MAIKQKKRSVFCGVTGCGDTIREARDNAIEKISETLNRLRDDSTPRVVFWRGYLRIIYRDVDGVGCASISNFGKSCVQCGPVKTLSRFSASVSMEEAEQRARQEVAELGWREEDGLSPPEIIRKDDALGQEQFRYWARWQVAYKAAKKDGASDDDAYYAATDACSDSLDTSAPKP